MKFIHLSQFQATPPIAQRTRFDAASNLIIVYEEGDLEPSTLEEHKDFTRAKLYAIASAKISELTSEYSLSEQIGWPQKEQEAHDYQSTQDPGLCPNLSAIATLRGVSLQSLVDTVLAKAAELRGAINAIDAKRGELCDLVAVAESIESVKSISWE